jgi:hypothetical protein
MNAAPEPRTPPGEDRLALALALALFPHEGIVPGLGPAGSGCRSFPTTATFAVALVQEAAKRDVLVREEVGGRSYREVSARSHREAGGPDERRP